jgi:uncharacterized protein (DUF305 family)
MKQQHGALASAFRHRNANRVALGLLMGALAAPAIAQEAHQHHGPANSPPPAFVASTAKPFAELMHDAMAVMDDGMRRAPMNGVAAHDFIAMMIPHHQGAIDMAKAMLLNTRDPELANLAQGIITEQQNEIRVMQAWLQRYEAAASSQPIRSK